MVRRGHGEGSIYQRKDGRWTAVITLEDRKRKTFYGKTRREVQEKLKIALREQQQGMLATGPQQTVKQFMEHWLENVHRQSIKLSTYVETRELLDAYILPVLGHIQLQRLALQNVQALYGGLQKKGLSASRIRFVHSVLHKALDGAVRSGLVARNVSDGVTLPRILRREMQVLSPDQAQRLVEAAKDSRLEALLILALTTGMRRGELLGSKWQENDLVFCNVYGNFLHPYRLYLMFNKVIADAGIPRVRFHDLRHSAATILLSLGVNVKVVQEILGHSRVGMTLDIYSHVLPGMQEDAADRMGKLFE